MYSARGDVRKGKEKEKRREGTSPVERRGEKGGGPSHRLEGQPTCASVRARQFLEVSVQCLRG